MPRARFTTDEVLAIRTDYARGFSLRRLALLHFCDKKQIQDIVQGRTYKTVGGPLADPVRSCPHCLQPMRKMA